MRAVAARVVEAKVTAFDEVVGEITEPGLLVLLGIHREDTANITQQMAKKLFELRILRDEQSCATTGAPLLIVSQFTLYGDARKGRRPAWAAAAPPEIARPLYEAVVTELRRLGAVVSTGIFGQPMTVTSANDGPFTVIVDV